MRHFLQKFTIAMAAAAVVLSGFTAKAAPSNVPENKPCSLTVTMRENGSGAAASGESIAIYQVGSEGSENGNYHFYYTADVFAEQYQAASGEQIPDDVVTSTKSAERFAQAAEKLVPYAQTKTDADGKASFADLPHGLYLVVQKDPSDRYLLFDPFLVSLPYYDKETVRYVYDVSALPKVQKEVNRYTPAAADPGVLKRVVGDGAPSSQTFRMVFHRLDASFPMMEGSTGDSKTMDIAADNAVHEFGTLTFTRAGDYYYEIYEDRSNAAENFTYDATVYRLEYQVREAGNALSVQRVIIRLNDAEGVVVYDGTDTAQHVVITNTYKAPGGDNNGGGGGPEEPPVTPPAALPQTGQLWWPVWLMAGAGSLLILLGLFSRRKAKA